MINSKRALADMTVSTGESWIGKLSNKELHEIFDSNS
jgi:SNF2 family DNA or RNA helicase